MPKPVKPSPTAAFTRLSTAPICTGANPPSSRNNCASWWRGYPAAARQGLDRAEIREAAEAILPITRAAEVPLVINDHWVLASKLGAEFCHLGQEDFEPDDDPTL